MSVRLFPLQSPTPNATPAIPTSRGNETESFQNLFAQSQRSNQKSGRDDAAVQIDDRSASIESKSRDAKESASEPRENDRPDETKPGGNEPDRADVARDEKPGVSEDAVRNPVEKQGESEQDGEKVSGDTSNSVEEKPVQIETIEPVEIDPAAALSGVPENEDNIVSSVVKSIANEPQESADAEGENTGIEFSDADGHTTDSNTTNDPTIELIDVSNTVDVDQPDAAAASVPVEQGVTQSRSGQGVEQRTGDTPAFNQSAGSVVLEHAGQQTNSDTDEQSGDSSNMSSANAAPAKTAGSSGGSFALPNAAIVAEPVATDAAQSAVPAITATDRPAEQPAAPVPLAQPNASELRDEANIARISRGLQSAVNQRGGNVTLRLDPPELGQVRIEMVVRDGVVTAKFTAQSEAVRRLLMDQMGQLRGALDRQGLAIDKLDVQATSNQNQSWNSSQENSHDGRSKGQHSQRQSHGQSGKQGADTQVDTFESQLEHAE